MWRQLKGIRRLRLELVTWDCRLRPEEVERGLNGKTVQVLPFERAPYNGRGRWLHRLRCLPGKNFYASVGAERRQLGERMRQGIPEVAFCHYGYFGLRILPVAEAFRVPVVAHFNGLDISLHNRWYRWSLLPALKRFAAIVVVSEHQRKWMLDHGVPEQKVHLIPYGVPVKEFAPSPEVSDPRCRFLSVGRFVQKKAPLETIRAFAACARENRDATLRMIGEGPLKNAAMNLANELGVGQQVEFLGAQPNEKVREEMQRACVFVQHSVTAKDGDMEGWPVAIGEAAASGLPVVATRHGGILEQVEHGETGFLVAEHDWEGMGQAMSQLAKDATLRGNFGAKARERAVQMFDVERQISKLEDVLLGVIQKREAFQN